MIGTALSAFETGQFCLASSAMLRNLTASMPGTSARTAMWWSLPGPTGFYRVSQGREVGHDAIIELQVDDAGDVWSGGRACTIVRGEIDW